MSVILQGIYNTEFLLQPRFIFLWAEVMAWRLTKSFFLSSLSAPSFFASVLRWYQLTSFWFQKLSKFLAHPEIEWYCMSHSAVSWYFIGSPPRITVIKLLVRPTIECLQAALCARAELLYWWNAFLREINLLTKLMGPSQNWMILSGLECGLTYYSLEPGSPGGNAE